MSDRTIILPDMTTISEDALEYRENHFDLFGHYPPRNPQEKCEHPLHDHIRREMNGANVIVAFDTGDIVSEDSLDVAKRKERYDRVVAETKQWQKEIEERQETNRLRKLGIIDPRSVY